jgi:hypothetical protein
MPSLNIFLHCEVAALVVDEDHASTVGVPRSRSCTTNVKRMQRDVTIFVSVNTSLFCFSAVLSSNVWRVSC